MCPRRSRWGKIQIILNVNIKNKNNCCFKIKLFKNRDEQIISSSITEESRITNAGECNNCVANYDEVKLTEEILSIESPKDAGENEQKTENSANLVPDYLEKLIVKILDSTKSMLQVKFQKKPLQLQMVLKND